MGKTLTSLEWNKSIFPFLYNKASYILQCARSTCIHHCMVHLWRKKHFFDLTSKFTPSRQTSPYLLPPLDTSHLRINLTCFWIKSMNSIRQTRLLSSRQTSRETVHQFWEGLLLIVNKLLSTTAWRGTILSIAIISDMEWHWRTPRAYNDWPCALVFVTIPQGEATLSRVITSVEPRQGKKPQKFYKRREYSWLISVIKLIMLGICTTQLLH